MENKMHTKNGHRVEHHKYVYRSLSISLTITVQMSGVLMINQRIVHGRL
jgi:hypothetical protein